LKILVYPFQENETAKVLRKEDAEVHPRFRPIIDYLNFHNRIIDIEHIDEEIKNIFSRDVLRKIRSGEEGWESCLPQYVDRVIKEKELFGYTAD
jgi:hypothetical protein